MTLTVQAPHATRPEEWSFPTERPAHFLVEVNKTMIIDHHNLIIIITITLRILMFNIIVEVNKTMIIILR